ncbi:MAG: restriction endonuclease subunit S [Prevotella sp.]|nr:restriction endonuclease subunit S [Prevotella sp.]
MNSAERAGLRPKGNVPTLRFPEFSGEWHATTIDGVTSEFQSGKFIKAELIQSKGSVPVYGGNGLRGYTDQYNHIGDYVLIGRQGALCGNVRFVTGETYITEHAIAVKSTEDNDTKYLQYLFERMNLGKYSDQSAQPGLAVSKLIKLKINIPQKREQSKIARLLTSIDERIATQIRIIEDLKRERKYFLEQLFCLPNERAPKLRLKGMTGEWHKVKLCDIVDRVTERNKTNTCNRVLTIAAQYGLIDQQEFFNKHIASSDLTTYYLLHRGDFAYNKSYSGDYSWGTVKRLDKYDEGVLSSLYICFRPNENVDSDFLCHYFESTKWYRGISEISGEGARNHGLLNMSVEDYFNTLHRIPAQREQKAVANALNVLVDKINIETEILNNLQKQKSYLLKEMFI